MVNNKSNKKCFSNCKILRLIKKSIASFVHFEIKVSYFNLLNTFKQHTKNIHSLIFYIENLLDWAILLF